MKFDIFFSICQTEVDGFMPSERVMFENFFRQVRLADELGFDTAWVAETHLSSEVQKRNPGAVIPHFKGEIGLNTDILQLAHKIFAQTKRISVGSAIRNILANGGPIAHAEAIRMFLSLHGLDPHETRRLDIGFASGRFPYSNTPYGVHPRDAIEKAAWGALKGLVFLEATEIFLRFLRGDVFASRDVAPKILTRARFRSDEDWARVVEAWKKTETRRGRADAVEIAPFWSFDEVGVIPFQAPLDLLRLTIGSHDREAQLLANQFFPVGVFNLSLTPNNVIEETHQLMSRAYHASGGPWSRDRMPRTALVFIDAHREVATARAQKTLATYWSAMEGTVDPAKVAQAVDNALVGTPDDILEQMQTRFHRDDGVMMWFDFNNHDTANVETWMRMFMERVANRF